MWLLSMSSVSFVRSYRTTSQLKLREENPLGKYMGFVDRQEHFEIVGDDFMNRVSQMKRKIYDVVTASSLQHTPSRVI